MRFNLIFKQEQWNGVIQHFLKLQDFENGHKSGPSILLKHEFSLNSSHNRKLNFYGYAVGPFINRRRHSNSWFAQPFGTSSLK